MKTLVELTSGGRRDYRHYRKYITADISCKENNQQSEDDNVNIIVNYKKLKNLIEANLCYKENTENKSDARLDDFVKYV